MNRDLTAHLTKKEEPPKEEPKEEPSALIEDFSPLTMVETPDIETPTDDFLKWSVF
jgi:hypothetical protein